MSMGNDYWEIDAEKHQKNAAILFNHHLPVHIVTKNHDWYNGYIKEYNGDSILVFDRVEGFTLIHFSEVSVLEQFRGDTSTLKRWDA